MNMIKKRTLTRLLCAAGASLLLCGCADGGHILTQTGQLSAPGADDTAAEATEEIQNPFEWEDKELASLVQPFWQTGTIPYECASMLLREDGTVTAKLLHVPEEIISVTDYSHKTVYKQGEDYTWEKGTNILVRTEGSSIPYFTINDLAGRDENNVPVKQWGDTSSGWSEDSLWDELGRARFGDHLYCVSEFYYGRQITVTYRYDTASDTAPYSTYQGDKLPLTTAKLQAGEKLRIVFYGDSVMKGNDASAQYGREPKQAPFYTLLEQAIEQRYSVKVTSLNLSEGGMDSAWGLENAQKRVCAKNPDLVVLGFGTNDTPTAPRVFISNIKKIIETIKADCPDTEFIIMTPPIANDAAGFMGNVHDFIPLYSSLKSDYAVCDIYSVHKSFLATKDYCSTSGNNINHPGDWFISVIAMNLFATLCK